MTEHPAKKWGMLQLWRVQQIAPILSLVMLALNLSLMLYQQMAWRPGPFSNPYIAVPILLVLIGIPCWAAAAAWDTKARMWRTQSEVQVSRNPYANDMLAPKEILLFNLITLPTLRALYKLDPDNMALKESIANIDVWVLREYERNPNLKVELGELTAYAGGKL